MQNFFVFMLTGVVIGLLLFAIFKIIMHFVKKRKIKNDSHTIE